MALITDTPEIAFSTALEFVPHMRFVFITFMYLHVHCKSNSMALIIDIEPRFNHFKEQTEIDAVY